MNLNAFEALKTFGTREEISPTTDDTNTAKQHNLIRTLSIFTVTLILFVVSALLNLPKTLHLQLHVSAQLRFYRRPIFLKSPINLEIHFDQSVMMLLFPLCGSLVTIASFSSTIDKIRLLIFGVAHDKHLYELFSLFRLTTVTPFYFIGELSTILLSLVAPILMTDFKTTLFPVSPLEIFDSHNQSPAEGDLDFLMNDFNAR
ncbi:hypothetical protein F2Q69_00002202 [Brassica cretica]|uniref:Uncharacterized protein n=1 Tax=Brassica cretica TaxID=69181 RepID=A0A8S9PGL0_BRACR|nr:hypothetical protein F2Q69_00002202 [Brassica cretica]